MKSVANGGTNKWHSQTMSRRQQKWGVNEGQQQQREAYLTAPTLATPRPQVFSKARPDASTSYIPTYVHRPREKQIRLHHVINASALGLIINIIDLNPHYVYLHAQMRCFFFT